MGVFNSEYNINGYYIQVMEDENTISINGIGSTVYLPDFWMGDADLDFKISPKSTGPVTQEQVLEMIDGYLLAIDAIKQIKEIVGIL